MSLEPCPPAWVQHLLREAKAERIDNGPYRYETFNAGRMAVRSEEGERAIYAARTRRGYATGRVRTSRASTPRNSWAQIFADRISWWRSRARYHWDLEGADAPGAARQIQMKPPIAPTQSSCPVFSAA